MTETALDRFWKYVDKRGQDECWNWKGAKNQDSYGKFSCEHGVIISAHRFSLIISGAEKTAACVLHQCDNPPCVNPRHLRWGTHKENMKERNERNKTYIENQRKAVIKTGLKKRVLNNHQIYLVLDLLADGFGVRECSRALNVAVGVIERVKYGQTKPYMAEWVARESERRGVFV